jgi:hypothetical protein
MRAKRGQGLRHSERSIRFCFAIVKSFFVFSSPRLNHSAIADTATPAGIPVAAGPFLPYRKFNNR